MANAEAVDHPLTERLTVTEMPMKRRPPPPSTEPAQPTKPDPSTEWRNPSLTEQTLRLAGYALSARALLLLALIGAFTLAVLAMMTETLVRVYILVAYCVLVVLPIVGLEIRKR